MKADKMTISDELRKFLLSSGAGMVGYADLTGLPADIRENLPCGISIAVALSPFIISRITDGPTLEYYQEIKRANQLLERLNRDAVNYIEERGYKAKGIVLKKDHFDPVTQDRVSYEPEAISTKLPHKTCATRSGLGWIGKNALLTTKTFGSAVRLTTILTNAGLTVNSPIDSSECGDCARCVSACPGHAPSGKNWEIGLSRDSFFNAFLCRETAFDLSVKNIGSNDTTCGICIVACPWTQKYLKRSS
jgi:epoxyqueuosine reductase QueG